MKFLRYILVSIAILSSVNISAQTYCESLTSKDLQNLYNANFLNKDFLGCFQSYLNGQEEISGSVGSFFAGIGVPSSSAENADIAQVTYIALASVANFITTSKQLNNGTDASIKAISSEAEKISEKMMRDLAYAREQYQTVGMKAIRENAEKIRLDGEKLQVKIDNMNKESARLASKSPPDMGTGYPSPPSSPYDPMAPINLEKDRWAKLENASARAQTIPFETLKQIYKANPTFGAKILEEFKYARYMELGLIPKTDLPLLTQVQKYESKANIYRDKNDYYKKSLDQNDLYYQQKKFVLTASSELKTIADQKLSQGDFSKANDGLDMATLALEITTSLPIAATGRGLYEFYSGKSLLTNRELTNLERGASLSMALIDLMPAAWIASGVRSVWLVGELGARLIERGLVKAGLEDALNLGVENTKRISEVFQGLIASGNAKVETIKKIISNAEKLGICESQEIGRNLNLLERVEPEFVNVVVKDADELNKAYINIGKEPPYHTGTKIVEFESDKVEKYIRYYNGEEPSGNWILRSSDIEVMDKIKIAEELNLPSVPTRVAEVTIPANVKMRMSTIGPNGYGNSYGKIQFEILEQPNPNWFKFLKDL